MNDVEVYIADLMLDLSPSTVVALTKQINDIAEIQRRQADYTNRFTVRKTPTNIAAAGFLNVPGNTSTRPYKWSVGKIVSNGIPITTNGQALIMETRDRANYDIIIYAGNYDLFSKIEGKYITDLNWEDLLHTFDHTAWEASWTNTDGYVYALAETLDGTLSYYRGGTASGEIRIDLGKQFPWVFVKTIWERIFSEAGLTYSGAIFDTDEFKEQIMLAARDYTKEVKTTLDKFAGRTAYTPPYLEWLFATPPISPVLELIDLSVITIPSDNYDEPTDKYTVPESGDYQFTVKANMGVQALEFFRMKIYVNGILEKTESYAINIANAFFTTYNFEVTASLLLTKDDEVEIYYELDNVSSSNAIAVRIGNYQVTIAQTSRKVLQYNSEIDFSKLLPNIKQIDFLKAIMQQYGMIYQPNQQGVYQFITIEDVLNGVAGFNDYTAKLHKETAENYSIGNYYRLNKFVYDYNDDDKNGNGYADSDFAIDIDNIPAEGELMKSIIEACGDYLLYDKWDTISSVHAYKNTQTDTTAVPIYELNANDKMIVARKVMHYVDFLDFGDGDNYIGFHFAVTQAVAQFKTLHWSVLMEKYYPKFIKMAQRPVKKTVALWLTPIDIYFLDMFKIIYLEQYQSYFYLNKVNNFLPGKLSDCELIKIN